ncbi:uncharacterized protein LOC110965327 [Acanthochromis polyacanthus]|uniref:uncharacterized protein LOC110965327 n=1 Tax=Acanthochromis polyacanthus TaxID=80966 RepID=UPI000B9048BF|nr:uncharacterized protein LOC110965327 [Acanthochromis polyacanthus]
MGLVHVALVVLNLLSAGQSAPVTSCESLLQPLEIQGRDQLLGRWTYIGESTDIPGSRTLTKMIVQTSWLNITAGDSNDTINTVQNQKAMGLCLTLSYKQTLKNNTISMEQPYPGSAILLNTGCPDCLVFYSNYTIGESTYKGVQLLSRRPKVSITEMEEFRKQIMCLNLPKPAVLDPEKGFCFEEPQGMSFDLTDSFNSMSSDQLNKLDKLFRSEGGVQTIMDMISSAVDQVNPH